MSRIHYASQEIGNGIGYDDGDSDTVAVRGLYEKAITHDLQVYTTDFFCIHQPSSSWRQGQGITFYYHNIVWHLAFDYAHAQS